MTIQPPQRKPPMRKSTATAKQNANMQATRSSLAALRAQKQKGVPATAQMKAQRTRLLATRAKIAGNIGRPLGQGPKKGGSPKPPAPPPPPSGSGSQYMPPKFVPPPMPKVPRVTVGGAKRMATPRVPRTRG